METFEDKPIICADCHESFVFTSSDQAFYAAHGFFPPRRCKPCRAQRKAEREAQQVAS